MGLIDEPMQLRVSLDDFIFLRAGRTSLSSRGELALDACELAAYPRTHTYINVYKYISNMCARTVRSYEGLKSATDDISCYWLHICT